MSVRVIWFLFQCSISLWVFAHYLNVSIKNGYLIHYGEKRILKSPIIVELPISPLSSVGFCFVYFEAHLLDAYVFIIVISF